MKWNFLGEVDRWLYQACKNHRMALVKGTVFGTEDAFKTTSGN